MKTKIQETIQQKATIITKIAIAKVQETEYCNNSLNEIFFI
jgi:hypothetical protein